MQGLKAAVHEAVSWTEKKVEVARIAVYSLVLKLLMFASSLPSPLLVLLSTEYAAPCLDRLHTELTTRTAKVNVYYSWMTSNLKSKQRFLGNHSWDEYNVD